MKRALLFVCLMATVAIPWGVHAQNTPLPIRSFVLDTLGNSIQYPSTDQDGNSLPIKGELRELVSGRTAKTWKVKYEKKGHNRLQCDPPMVNITFDKTDSKGKPKELFTGMSTYPGYPALQYQEIRLVPDCDPSEDTVPWLTELGLEGNLNVQLRETFSYKTLRKFKVPAPDIIGFAKMSFASADSKYNGKEFNYFIVQRDNEQDDQMPFTRQFNFDPNLIQDSSQDKWRSASGVKDPLHFLEGFTLFDVKANKNLTVEYDPETTIRYWLLASFLGLQDRGPIKNQDLGRDLATGKWKQIPFGFDFAVFCKVVDPGIILYLGDLPQEKQTLFKKLYYQVAREIFGNAQSLQYMIGVVDQFPFPVEKSLFKRYLAVSFHKYAQYFGSENFAQRMSVPYVAWGNMLPFPSEDAYMEEAIQFQEDCARKKFPSPSVLITFKDNPRLEISALSSSGDTLEDKSLELKQLRFNAALFLRANEEGVFIPKEFLQTSPFFAQIVDANNQVKEKFTVGYIRPREGLEDIPGFYYRLPKGVDVEFDLFTRYSVEVLQTGKPADNSNGFLPGKYRIVLSKLHFGSKIEDKDMPPNASNEIELIPQSVIDALRTRVEELRNQRDALRDEIKRARQQPGTTTIPSKSLLPAAPMKKQLGDISTALQSILESVQGEMR